MTRVTNLPAGQGLHKAEDATLEERAPRFLGPCPVRFVTDSSRNTLHKIARSRPLAAAHVC